MAKMLKGIKYEDGTLEVMDQTLLPSEEAFIEVKTIEDGWMVINKTQVKGESATAIVACLSLAMDLEKDESIDKMALRSEIERKVNYLLSANPHAAIMRSTCDQLIAFSNSLCEDESQTLTIMKTTFIEKLQGSLEKDMADNKVIGEQGANSILANLGDSMATILTHGNTGSLATGGWGTALGVIKTLRDMKKLEHVYFTETRSTNVGAIITAYELVHEHIAATIIIDSVVGPLLRKGKINAILVGAYSIAKNGDFANEIGTYQMAILAKSHNVPFYVAGPSSIYNSKISNGDEMNLSDEAIRSTVISARGAECWNPSYDITPASYVSLVITEKGAFKPRDLSQLKSE